MIFGFGGPGCGVSSACGSSAHAIAEACHEILLDRADAMLAIGAEECVSPFEIACFDQMKTLSRTGRSLPFGKERDGFVMGSGGAALLLANYDYAQKMGWPILAEIIGYATNSDANNMVAPSMTGISHCMELALEDAQINSSDVDYINSHATSTPTGDPVEAQAIWKVFFGGQPFFAPTRRPLINSSKGALAHTLGAAGALELIVTIESLRSNVIHPMGDYEPDPICLQPPLPNCKEYCWKSVDKSLPIVQQKTEAELKVGMSCNFGFGGHNCSIIVAKPGWNDNLN